MAAGTEPLGRLPRAITWSLAGEAALLAATGGGGRRGSQSITGLPLCVCLTLMCEPAGKLGVNQRAQSPAPLQCTSLGLSGHLLSAVTPDAVGCGISVPHRWLQSPLGREASEITPIDRGLRSGWLHPREPHVPGAVGWEGEAPASPEDPPTGHLPPGGPGTTTEPFSQRGWDLSLGTRTGRVLRASSLPEKWGQ